MKNYIETSICHIFILYDKSTNGWIYYHRYYVDKFTERTIEKHYQFLGGKIDFTVKWNIAFIHSIIEYLWIIHIIHSLELFCDIIK